MEITTIAAIVVFAVTLIMIFLGVRNWWPVKSTPKAKSGSAATTTAGTSGGAAAATATPTPPTPLTPAPAAPARSWGWVWCIIIIITVVLIGRWVWYEGRSVRSTYSPPQTIAPQTVPQTHLQNFKTIARLIQSKSVGVPIVSKNPRGDTHFAIQDGGKALLFADFPQGYGKGTAYFKSFVTRYYAGELWLEVNGTLFRYAHKGGGRNGRSLQFPASCLYPGTNSFVLSSPCEDIFVEKVEIEIDYE